MLKTEKLLRSNEILKDYVCRNNPKLKKNLTSIFMNSRQIKQFYHSMQVGLMDEATLDSRQAIDLKNRESQRKKEGFAVESSKTLIWRVNPANRVNASPAASASLERGKEIQQLCRNNNLKISDRNAKMPASKLSISESYPKSQVLTQKNGYQRINRNQYPKQNTQFSGIRKQSQKAYVQRTMKAQSYVAQRRKDMGFSENVEKIAEIKTEIEQSCIENHRRNKFQKSRSLKQQIVEQGAQKYMVQKPQDQKLKNCFRKIFDKFLESEQRPYVKEVEMLREKKRNQAKMQQQIQTYFVKKNRYNLRF